MLETLKADVVRGTRQVLHQVSLRLEPGQVLGVLGANGAGKSSLLSLLSGELPPAHGQVQLDGQALAQWPVPALARRRAVLPQTPALRFDLGVDEVVRMGAYPFPELPPAALHDLATQALDSVEALPLAGRRYVRLSGGEQQRVQFARVLVQLLACHASGEYRALLLDEPTASLDPRHQIGLLRATRHWARTRGVAAMVVLHDVNLAASWCDRIALLAGGKMIGMGTPRQVLTEAHLHAAYGLAARVLDHPEQPEQPWVLFHAPTQGSAHRP